MALLQSPLTYEGVLELFRQTDRKIQELAEIVKNPYISSPSPITSFFRIFQNIRAFIL